MIFISDLAYNAYMLNTETQVDMYNHFNLTDQSHDKTGVWLYLATELKKYNLSKLFLYYWLPNHYTQTQHGCLLLLF